MDDELFQLIAHLTELEHKNVLYAAAILCKKETENLLTVIGKPSFDRIFHDYISKVWSVKKKTASFLLFAHYASEKTVAQLMNMLKTITEETDYILSRIDEFEDLMHFPSETYHPLREDEWELIQFIAEHNINLLNSNPKQKKEILHDVFGI